MGKISPVSAKYIIHATISIDGVVDRPDVIGAIFGQTEGLLGSDLELRELQRSGRIGRIEVSMDAKSGKAVGSIIIPSSLDKAETAIVAAALEIIQRIGPCNAKILCTKIEDVRVSKRAFVIDRAKELLQTMVDTSMPDSQELADEVSQSVRVMEIREYGRERLPAGPSIDDSDEIIIVEGRADVLNLLKHGFKNAIALNGTSVPESIAELTRQKTVTAFVDGDRGGDLIIKELLTVAELDFVTKAPDGKEVEEITKKEIHKCLRSRITAEQAQMELAHNVEKLASSRPQFYRGSPPNRPLQRPMQPAVPQSRPMQPLKRTTPVRLTDGEKTKFRSMAEDLVGTRGGYILDQALNILGKVPVAELAPTIKSLHSGMYAVILDGKIEGELLQVAEDTKVRHLIGMDSSVESTGQVNIVTAAEL